MRDEVTAPQSGLRPSGGTLALLVTLLSGHATTPDERRDTRSLVMTMLSRQAALPDEAPLFSYESQMKVFKTSSASHSIRNAVLQLGKNLTLRLSLPAFRGDLRRLYLVERLRIV